MRKLCSFLCVLSMLVACSAKPVDINQNVCGFECETSDMSEYTSLAGVDHVFLDVTYEEALQFLKSEEFSGILYYGYPACPWCEEAVVEMNDAAKAMNVDIYYINKKSDFNIAHPELEEATETILNTYFALDLDKEGKPHLYVPEVVVIKKGKVVDHHLGTFEEHDAHERTLNEKEKQTLEAIYVEMFQKMK